MSTMRGDSIIDFATRTAPTSEVTVSTDGQLLRQYVSRHDEDAFTTLVCRHGPMVLAVCRRMLGHAQDVEDAFQVTFHTFARKAASVTRHESIGAWLYRVAYHAALNIKIMNERRQTHERQTEAVLEPVAQPEESWRELVPVLDKELNRLPEKYRKAVVLCELQGESRKEAAKKLGIAEGTLSSRLATARQMLARRLGRYGTPVSSVALMAMLSEGSSASVPAHLVTTAVKAAASAAASRLKLQP